MPVWTFTSGPNKGKSYEGSRDTRVVERDDASALVCVKDLLSKGMAWGSVSNLTVRRDTSVVKTHPRGYLATFDLVHDAGIDPSRFEDVPVVDAAAGESGETLCIHSNCTEGALAEAVLLSGHTAVIRLLSEDEAGRRRLELRRAEARRERARDGTLRAGGLYPDHGVGGVGGAPVTRGSRSLFWDEDLDRPR
mmetsp:Transcript_131/g.559  ORF Transcript_131/g.559 Transcript_131/m.559 type:complete len:193 (-) Transcript_131:64-642(-)